MIFNTVLIFGMVWRLLRADVAMHMRLATLSPR